MVEPQTILENLKSGRKEAFQLLFYTYYSNLVAYSVSIVEDIQTAEDLVQDFFVSFWQKKAYESVTSLESYLFFSIRNASLNAIRERNRHSRQLGLLTSDPLLELFHTDAHIRAEEEFDFTKIYRAIEKLPPVRKRIFKMCYFKNNKYQEVADKMNISVNTVKVQMGRAIKFLRENSYFFVILFCFFCVFYK